MALLVWFTVGLALWHFTVFIPDRFWGGIVGALLGAAAGSMFTGGVAQVAMGRGIGETDLVTVIVAVPGAILGIAFIYVVGARAEAEAEAEAAGG